MQVWKLVPDKGLLVFSQLLICQIIVRTSIHQRIIGTPLRRFKTIIDSKLLLLKIRSIEVKIPSSACVAAYDPSYMLSLVSEFSLSLSRPQLSSPLCNDGRSSLTNI